MTPSLLGYLCMACVALWMAFMTFGTFWFQKGVASIEVWVFAVVTAGLLYLCYMMYPL